MKVWITAHCKERYIERISNGKSVNIIEILNSVGCGKDITNKIFTEIPRYILYLYEKYNELGLTIIQNNDIIFILKKKEGALNTYLALTCYKDENLKHFYMYKNTSLSSKDIYIKIAEIKRKIKKKKMTTLRKLISEIDFNNKNIQSSPNWEDLGNLFNIYDLYSDDKRLKAYHIKKWYCTDSFVGLRAYFLDNEFVATSYQVGRKYDEDFTFVSKEVAEKVRNYLLSLIEPEEININVDIFDNELDEEIPSTYKIEFNSQILHETALYNGERVTILKKRYNWDEKDKYFHTVKIENSLGKKFEVDIKELDFEYNV